MALPQLPPRPRDANKGNFGRVLVVAGSRGMSGAAVLCGSAALRGGAGLVRVAVPASIFPIVAAGNPCYMTAPLPEDEHGCLSPEGVDAVLSLLERSTVAVLGPGLVQTTGPRAIVNAVIERSPVPLVLDADALNVLAGSTAQLHQLRVPAILTPHPGEFGRLLGCDTAAVQADRAALATRFAAEHGVVVVLKGKGTIVTDGRHTYVNTTGNPGMATGGTGDVLAGLIGAFLAQGLSPFEAAQLGVHAHGKAGDVAAEVHGEVGLIATDLLDYLPAALRSPGP
jgi:ADP-dependent NAD(P)H-hydrate dehydratase